VFRAAKGDNQEGVILLGAVVVIGLPRIDLGMLGKEG